MIQSFEESVPTVAESAYVHEAAVVIGDVVLEPASSVWPNATLRGDSGRIVVGEGANVQDNAVLHEGTVLEADVTVGHSAIVHDATVSRGALVGMNAVVLDGAEVGEDAIVGAGAVVTEGSRVPAATLVTGVPAKPTAEIDDPSTEGPAAHYRELARRHDETSRRID